MDRRTFHRLCGGLLGGAAALHREHAVAFGGGIARDGANARRAATARDRRSSDTADSPNAAVGPWPCTRLVDADDTPLTLASLAPGESRIFHYPYRVTPCFLLRLAPTGAATASEPTTPAAAVGGWPGGLGDDGSIVAFSAICSHKMSHPARPISHIAYRAEPLEFVDRDGARRTRAGLISCCSERSVYDPADGARVLAGPAPVPLAAIELALDDDGAIVAVASLGLDRYERFLDTFGFRLALEHGSSDVRRRSGDIAAAVPADGFSRQQIRC